MKIPHISDVGKLVAGQSVYMCDECVKLCDEIVSGEGKSKVEWLIGRFGPGFTDED